MAGLVKSITEVAKDDKKDIKDLIEEQGKVNLFTRLRRFGKTLALSMIRTFFEKEYDITGNLIDNTEYFAKMKIWQEKEICEKYQGKKKN